MNARVTAVLLCELVVVGVCTLWLADRRAHQDDPNGVPNQWGYRHIARAAKDAAEVRVALIGGSSAYEGAVPYGGTLAGTLGVELRNAAGDVRTEFSVANIAEPQAGADAYVRILGAYEYLDPDVVCIFDGYDVLSGLPPHSRFQSATFRALGYLPLLPSRILGTRVWLSDEDRGIAPALRDDASGDVGCNGLSAAYCEAIATTVRFALAAGHIVVVATPPLVSARHGEQQRSLAEMLRERFSANERFRYLDLGRALDLRDPVNSPDRIHRTPVANHVIGQQIALGLIRWRGASVDRLRATRHAAGSGH